MARFLTADVEQLIRDGTNEKERLSLELRQKVKQMGDAEATIKKSSQVLTNTHYHSLFNCHCYKTCGDLLLAAAALAAVGPLCGVCECRLWAVT